jgi:hypothetical protein
MAIDDKEEKTSQLRKIIENGSEIAGGAIGSAIGFFAGDPATAAALGAGGVLAANALKYIGNEIYERKLSEREKVRIGGVLAITAAEIKKRLEAGDAIRNDDFFKKKKSGRSDADEVAESVLLKSQREPEEKKIPYMGYLLASFAFDAGISAEMAHQLTKTAETLTYRQLCLMLLIVAKNEFNLRKENYRKVEHFSRELLQILYECYDLYQRGLINNGGTAALGLNDLTPADLEVQGLGSELFKLMQVRKIPIPDILPIVLQLK